LITVLNRRPESHDFIIHVRAENLMCSQNFSLLQVSDQLLPILGSLAVEEARLTNGGRDSHKVIVTCNIVSKREEGTVYNIVYGT
jgi:hypothetical protein